jgi:hypothetical protein
MADSPYTVPANVRNMVQVRTGGGMPYNSFPDVDDPTLQRWINNRTGEAHLKLAKNGAPVPIDPALSQAHADLFAFLSNMIDYGAAATLEGTPTAGQDPNTRQATSNYYQAEYTRMLTELDQTYNRDALIALGIIPAGDPAAIPGIGGSFGLVGNARVTPPDASPAWLNNYPVRRGGTLPGGLGGA